MVVALINDSSQKIRIVKTGWDAKQKDSAFYEDYAKKFEEALMDLCEQLNIDPEICNCDIDMLTSGLGNPIEEAKKLVRRTIKRLRLTS